MTRGALYVQAIRGPLVLITVGVLFAIHQAGILNFARTWPLIIIVIGVVKLAERLLMQPVYPPPPNYTGAPNYAGSNYPGANYPGAGYPPPPPPPGAPRT